LTRLEWKVEAPSGMRRSKKMDSMAEISPTLLFIYNKMELLTYPPIL
jgi:hypothetical protein